MRQNYYCPNCGTPVTCGALFCTGCGVNFQWVAPPEPVQCPPVTYRLPDAGPHHNYTDGQSGIERISTSGTGQECNENLLKENNSAHAEARESKLKSEVSRLLDSFFEKASRCHKA